VGWCNLQHPESSTVVLGRSTEIIYGRVHLVGVTPGVGQGAGIRGELGFGPQGGDPAGASWHWVVAAYNVDADGLVPGDLANDEYMATLTPAALGTYDVAYRFSADNGLSYKICDRDGSDNGYSSAQAGTLVVVAPDGGTDGG